MSASLTNSTTLVINFSEILNTSTAQNINNYQISNGINVLSSSLSGAQVTLSTSEHQYGGYAVTVSNITDVAGNVVLTSKNSSVYEMG